MIMANTVYLGWAADSSVKISCLAGSATRVGPARRKPCAWILGGKPKRKLRSYLGIAAEATSGFWVTMLLTTTGLQKFASRRGALVRTLAWPDHRSVFLDASRAYRDDRCGRIT